MSQCQSLSFTFSYDFAWRVAGCGQLALPWTQLKAKKPGGRRPGPCGTLSCGLRRDLNGPCTDGETGSLSLTPADCACRGTGLQERSAIQETLTAEMEESPWQAGRQGHCRRGLDLEHIITFSLML